MKIPQPLETLFNHFPLKTFPKQEIDSDTCLEKFSFLKKSSSPHLSTRFLLTVHNIRNVQLKNQESRFLATDPASLADALILCYNHDLAMPRAAESTKLKNVSNHSIVPMSYLASPNDQLPILVETSEETTKCITTASKISFSIASKSFSLHGIDSLVNFFMDNLQTLWVFTILHEISFSSTEVLNLVFYDRSHVLLETNVTTEPGLSVLDTLQLIEDMQSWCNFKDKYSHLYSGHAESIRAPLNALKHVVMGPQHTVSSESFKKAYASDIAEFFKILPLAATYIREKEESKQQAILEIKLASFIVCCVYFLPRNSVIKTILSKDHEDLIDWSVGVVLKY